MDKITLELWKDRADFWALLFAFVVGVVGEFVAHFAYRHFSRQLEPILAEEDQQLKQNVASAKVRAVEAELALRRYREGRQLDFDSFVAALKDKPAGVAEILFDGDNETWNFAIQIAAALNSSSTGWRALGPTALPSVSSNPSGPPVPPIILMHGSTKGVVIVGHAADDLYDTTKILCSLGKAFGAAKIMVYSGQDVSLPSNMVRVLVGAQS